MKNAMLAETLVELRRQTRKARFEVASEMGISYSALTAYELGERMPKDAAKVKIARYYNTSIEDLFYPQMEASDANG